MSLASKLDRIHLQARQNKWLWSLTVFCRITLAYAFIFAGFVKVNGERFTVLSNNHPMGSYLQAFYETGYYYTFVGVLQMLAGALLLIPRTATLGAVIYFPIILNICILSLAVRFDGSIMSSPLMVIANIYLLCWDYHKIKYILPLKHQSTPLLPRWKNLENKFPIIYFIGGVATVLIVIVLVRGAYVYAFMPRNTFKECIEECEGSGNVAACVQICECIHKNGQPLNICLESYNEATATPVLSEN